MNDNRMNGPHDAKPTIFVSVASYRDSECPWTLADMFAKAKHPERVFAGVFWQVAPEDPEAWRQVPERSAQVRGRTVDAATSLGVCWARSRIQTELWQGEEYYLQIDSHSRFAPDWDETLLAVLAACPSPKPVLTTHPIRYEPPDTRSPDVLPILTAGRFNDTGVLMPKAKGLTPPFVPDQPAPTAFIGAGLVFAASTMIREVPYDPNLYFHGEEVSLAARLWTHGYDLFSPNRVILYHDYTDRGRRRHWSDHQDWPTLNRRSEARLHHLLEIKQTTDAEALRDLDRYGLGQQRTWQEYEAFADVDFLRRRIGPRAVDGCFPLLPPETEAQLAQRRCFSQIYIDNGWKAWDTRSGPGSTWKATAELRASLRAVLQELGVRTLVDAGCGDLVWNADLTVDLDLYLGFDVVPELVARNRVLYGQRKNHFFNTADICTDLLPRCDAILCRNIFTHLPNAAVQSALRQFRRSESRYLLATTFPQKENGDIQVGQWRPVDLTAAPFALPPPQRVVPDGTHGAAIGVWKLAEW
ncbi:MAG: hypothetical protein HQL87_02150 [Magnetococcales bacterium]|nr:hypothetical protein [Magnetococcales bacterium]